MKHQGTVTLESNRLLLKRFTLDDAKNVHNNWCSDPKTVEFMSWPLHKNVKETEQVVRKWLELYERNDYYHWVIALKNSDTLIGAIAVVKNDEHVSSAELGYCLGSKYWNQGYMSEAVETVIKFLFNVVMYQRIQAKFDVRNQGSYRVMQKNNMRLEGIMQKAIHNNKGIGDAGICAILIENFQKKS